MTQEEELKKLLFDNWGKIPAEWDGCLYGGGKGSQRYLEYMWTIEQMCDDPPFNLEPVLDIGCGKYKFLQNLFNEKLRIISVDEDIEIENLRAHKKTLEKFIKTTGYNLAFINKILCVSVLEHVADLKTFAEALDKFHNATIIMTCEHGTNDNYLVNADLYKFFSFFKNHYIHKMERCPVLSDNSDGTWSPLGIVLKP